MIAHRCTRPISTLPLLFISVLAACSSGIDEPQEGAVADSGDAQQEDTWEDSTMMESPSVPGSCEADATCVPEEAPPSTRGTNTTPQEPEPPLADPFCEAGIRNPGDTVCCPASCGSCGGVGCEDRPGGEDACCAGAISGTGVSCNAAVAPCVLESVDTDPGGGGTTGTGGTPGTGGTDSGAPSGVPQPPASCSNVDFPIPNYVEVHTVIDKSVERPDFPEFANWYTEDENAQRFQLHQGDTNLANPNIPRPRVEAYAPRNDVWTRTGQNDWHEFSANYYLDSWENPWRYAVFQIKTNDASNFIIQGIIDDDGSLQIARRSKGTVTLDNNVFQKPFHLRVRSNGYRFQVYYNCELVLEENHPQPNLEDNQTRYGWRWGLYRQEQKGSDFQKGTTTMFVTGPQWD